jgi:hypothetical protein
MLDIKLTSFLRQRARNSARDDGECRAQSDPTHFAPDSSRDATRPFCERIEQRKSCISVRTRQKQEVRFVMAKKNPVPRGTGLTG